MAAIITPQPVSVEEYIARFVEGEEEPMCEYLEGELQPKPMPTQQHSQVQANVIFYIRSQHDKLFRPLPELTVRPGIGRFLVPDLAVADQSRPIEGRYPGPGDAVFLCVEILSPDRRVGRLFGKCEEYHAWGVPHCWVIDPERKVAWEYEPQDVEPRRAEGFLRAGVVEIPLDEVFREV